MSWLKAGVWANMRHGSDALDRPTTDVLVKDRRTVEHRLRVFVRLEVSHPPMFWSNDEAWWNMAAIFTTL